MKPGDHPEFFRFPAPEGRSRESTIRLDGDGRFFHDGEVVEHAKLAQAMHGWIAKHPDDGRFILTNGYDWTYFTVEDVPYFVRALREEAGSVTLVLSDGTEERFDPAPDAAWLDARGAVAVRVKGGAFVAKFDRHAMAALSPYLVESSPDAAPALKIGDRTFVLERKDEA